MEDYLSEQELQLLNPAFIQKLIEANEPISVTTYRLTPEIRQYLRKVASLFLHEVHQEAMEEYLTFCIAELIDNSQKANAKRIYFRERNLDIFSPDDYCVGMETFKSHLLSNQRHYQGLQEEQGLSITMSLGVQDQAIYLEVRNNSKLTVFEYKRIHDRIMRALQSKSPTQILSHIDESEGAGLGFISITYMLSKLGITEESIEIIAQDDDTIIRIRLPENREEQHIAFISKEIADAIQNIPQLPENIGKITRLLDNPASEIGEIVSLIQQDVTLSTDLLKLANSASFRMTKAPTNIEDSVKMVGLRGVSNLIYAVGSLQNLGPVTKDKRSLWRHSFRVGTCSLALAHKFYSTDNQVVADAYVCGLLHDIGKILFEAAHPETLQALAALCAKKGIPSRVFEKIVAGANHAEIGALITQKWNFPEVITAAIKFHHSPAAAPPQYRKIVDIVYLANALFHYQEGSLSYAQLNSSTLDNLGIAREGQIQALLKELAG